MIWNVNFSFTLLNENVALHRLWRQCFCLTDHWKSTPKIHEQVTEYCIKEVIKEIQPHTECENADIFDLQLQRIFANRVINTLEDVFESPYLSLVHYWL